MATSSVPTGGHLIHRQHAVGRSATRLPMPVALDSAAVFGLAVSAWAGLAPFIGPSFGYDAAGGQSLHWTLARALLSVAPAIAGVVGGLLLLGSSGAWRHHGRSGMLFFGAFLLLLAGAWFALGTFAWQPINHSTYVTRSGPLDGFAAMAGIAVGPGLILAMLGGIVIGWLGGSPRIDAAAPEVAEVRDVQAGPLASTPLATTSTPPATTQDNEPLI